MYIPDYERYKRPSEEGKSLPSSEIETNTVIPSILQEDCPYNNEGLPGSTDSSGILRIMKMLHIVMDGYVHYNYAITSDNTSMMKHMTYPETRTTGKKNIGDYLPKDIHVPQWFAEPSHNIKCFTGGLFELIKMIKSMKKLDALRLKKYYSYYIKMKRKKEC